MQRAEKAGAKAEAGNLELRLAYRDFFGGIHRVTF